MARRDDNDFVSADDKAAEMLDAAAKSTPWWAISLAFHALILAGLPLIVFSATLIADRSEPIVIKMTKPDTRKIFDLPEAPPGARNEESNAPADLTAPDEPEIHFPEAIDGTHNEKDDKHPDEHGIHGDSLAGRDALEREAAEAGFGRIHNGSAGKTDVIGPGGGGGDGSSYGTPGGHGSMNIRFRPRPRGPRQNAVMLGLRWLARHQAPDGSWPATGFHGSCPGGTCTGEGLSDFDVGVTGLAVLSFLGAGYTQQSRYVETDPVTSKRTVWGDVVRKGIKWLLDHQDAEGAFGPRVGEMMYNHAIATLALSEAYGLTSAVAYRSPAQKGISFIHTAQNYGLGWRYTPRCGNNDTSVTGWCVMALKSAELSNLPVARTAFEGAKAWINRVTDSNGMTGYDRLGSGQIFVPGKNEQWASHPTNTAVAVLCRIFIDKKRGDPALAQGSKIIAADLARWDENKERPTIDSYYWYYATLALYQLDGPEGPTWKRWSAAIDEALLKHQAFGSAAGCAAGSWEPGVDRWNYAGGRVATTALDVLTLETVYRYENVFGGH
jgi:hypothetical protein